MQTTFRKCVSFNPFSIGQYVLAAPKVDISWCHVVQAFMVSLMVVVIDEPLDLLLQVTGQEVVFQQYSVLQCLMPAFDLALGLWVIWRTANMTHTIVAEPVSKFV